MSSASLMETDQSQQMQQQQQQPVHYSIDGTMETSAAVTEADAAWFDLKPDRNLLDVNFEGYKLSLNSFTQYKLDLASSGHQLDTRNFIDSPSAKQQFFLYQHLKIFGMQNLLVANQFNSDLYYFDVNHCLVKVVYTSRSGLTMPSVRNVSPTTFSLPAVNPERTSITMRFVSATSAVVFDGYNTLYVIQLDQAASSSDPAVSENWSVVFKWQINDADATASVLKDAIVYENAYHVLLINVQEVSGAGVTGSDKFNTILNWIAVENNQSTNAWQVKRVRKLNCYNSVPDYACLETNGQSVYIAGPEFIKFSHDSVNSANIVSTKYDSSVSMRSVETRVDLNEKFYTWSQTADEITVCLRLNLDSASEVKINRADLTVNLNPDHIEVFHLNQVVMSGHFNSKIKVDESTWTLNANVQPNSVEFVLAKAKSGEMWSGFLKDQDRFGQYVLNEEEKSTLEVLAGQRNAEADDPTTRNKTLFTLEQQLEECDGLADDQQAVSAGDAQSEQNFMMIRRLDGNTHLATHKAYINENRVLFEARQSANKMPALCLRHDVDGIVWQPHRVSSPAPSETVWLTHDHTFLAFGYVQASKQEAKFRVCSPDCSYVCVVDTCKHIYVYKQDSEKVESSLRNRKTGQTVTHVAKQFMISLESDKEIYGVHATNDYLVVLLSDACYLYQVNPNAR
jgi:hypothetical protein